MEITVETKKSTVKINFNNNRDLTQAGRRRDDGGQNHLVKTSYCKESLSSIIHHTKSIQLKKEQCMAS